MDCSVPGCEGTAVIQWAKQLSDEAAEAYLGQARQQMEAVSEAQRLGLRVRMAYLQDAYASPPESLSPKDAEVFQAQASKQIEALREEHNAIPTTFDLEHHRNGLSTSLGHCADHVHKKGDDLDADWYAREHQADCSGAPDCGCSS